MDVQEVRLRNYRTLLVLFRRRPEEESAPDRGLYNRFAAFCGVSPRYLSHVNNGRKNLGEESCRAMESAFGLPRGWMDFDHLAGPGPISAEAREFVEMALKFFNESPGEAQAMLLKLMAEKMFDAAAKKKKLG